MVYSECGLNGMSQAFHSLYRARLARGYWRDRPRPILINNWEATYFDSMRKDSGDRAHGKTAWNRIVCTG